MPSRFYKFPIFLPEAELFENAFVRPCGFSWRCAE
jgi:hypothetical protein